MSSSPIGMKDSSKVSSRSWFDSFTFLSTYEVEFKTSMLLTLIKPSIVKLSLSIIYIYIYIYIYDTIFTTNDEPNMMEGVGVLANCESTMIEIKTLWLDYNSTTSYEIFKLNGLSNATLRFEKSKRKDNFVMSFLGDRTTRAFTRF